MMNAASEPGICRRPRPLEPERSGEVIEALRKITGALGRRRPGPMRTSALAANEVRPPESAAEASNLTAERDRVPRQRESEWNN
jgi:hypothetical protein